MMNKQSIDGDNNMQAGRDINYHATGIHKSQLRNTIDKIFNSIPNLIPKPIGVSVHPKTKISHNQLSQRWMNKINSVAPIYSSIEDCCNESDSSYYDSNVLIQLFAFAYQTDYQEQFKNKEITADEVLDGIVEFYIQSFAKKGCAEEHDRHTLPIIVAYAFIECGVLEKP